MSAKQSPHEEYDRGFSNGWDACAARTQPTQAEAVPQREVNYVPRDRGCAMVNEQPEALRLADLLETAEISYTNMAKAAAELRRLHAEVEEQCRLNAMGQEREARMMAENEELRRTIRLIVSNVRRKDKTND